jgi:hypothetical protein
MGLAQSIDAQHIEANAKLKALQNAQHLDHSSVATLRAVTDATQAAISNGPTTWDDVEKFLHIFGNVDITVRDAFPGARVVSALAEKANKTLEDRGFTADNTLFSASVCPDEINHVYNNLSQMFTRTWGECFQMGGLAGVPFSGQTGFGAFSAHIPDNGHLFILFAPHVGISPAGEFGLYAREGQCADCGTACGSAIAAYKHITKGGDVPDFTHLGKYPYDYQQQWIISQLAPMMPIINAAENKMVELSKQMYYIIEKFILNIVSTTSIPTGSMVLLGGVHINTPTEMEDFFWPIKFEIQRHNKPAEDLIHLLRSDLRDVVEVKKGESPPPLEPRMSVTRMLVRTLSTKNDHDFEASLGGGSSPMATARHLRDVAEEDN